MNVETMVEKEIACVNVGNEKNRNISDPLRGGGAQVRIWKPSPVHSGLGMGVCSTPPQKTLLGAKRTKWERRCQIKRLVSHPNVSST